MGYDSKNRMLTKVLGNNEMYNYGYSNDDVLKQISVVDTFNITNNISYDSRLNPSNINNGSLKYAFTYDIFGRLITVIQNGSFVIRNNYLVRTINGEQFATNILTSSTYENGDYYQYSYDDNDYLIEIKLNGKVIVTYINDEFGNVVSSQKYGYDKNGNLTETVKRKYLYDCGQLMEVIDEKVTIKTLVENGILKKVNYIYNDSSRSIDYIDGGEVSELGMNGYVG